MKILWDLKILWETGPEGPKFCEILSHSVRIGTYAPDTIVADREAALHSVKWHKKDEVIPNC